MSVIKTIIRDEALQRALERQQRFVDSQVEHVDVPPAHREAAGRFRKYFRPVPLNDVEKIFVKER